MLVLVTSGEGEYPRLPPFLNCIFTIPPLLNVLQPECITLHTTKLYYILKRRFVSLLLPSEATFVVLPLCPSPSQIPVLSMPCKPCPFCKAWSSRKPAMIPVGFWAPELTLSFLSHLQGMEVSWDKACWDVDHQPRKLKASPKQLLSPWSFK